jgi:hypothetical protein
MTEDDKFFERLREDAQALRYQPADDVVWTRLAARINERVRPQPTVSSLLAGWFRPMAASLAALAVIAALSVPFIEEPASVDAVVAAGQPPMDLGEMLSVE